MTTKEELKDYFKAGDRPSDVEFAELIDETYNGYSFVVDCYPGTDDEKVAAALAEASSVSGTSNRTASVYFAERVYNLTQPIISNNHVSWIGLGGGRRSTILNFTNDNIDDTALVTLNHGHGTVFENFQIQAQSTSSGVTGLFLSSLSSGYVHNFSVDLSKCGPDSIGVSHDRVTDWAESNVVERFNVIADCPLVVMLADNCYFRDFDMTCLETNVNTRAAGIQGIEQRSIPDTWVFGPGSIQKGKHAVYFDHQNAGRTGSGLALRDIRYEQNQPTAEATWHVVMTTPAGNNRLDVLNIVGCRSFTQPTTGLGANFEGITVRQTSGNFITGTKIGF